MSLLGDRRLFRGTKVRTEEANADVQTVPLPQEPRVIPPGSPQAVDASCVRSLLTVHGVISDVTLSSRGDAPALEAGIDATNAKTGESEHVVLVWLGRTQIAGIHPGREIVATARICDESDGHVMYNPRYDLR